MVLPEDNPDSNPGRQISSFGFTAHRWDYFPSANEKLVVFHSGRYRKPGSQRDTRSQYLSYDSPNLRFKVGSSYSTTQKWKTATTRAA